MATNRITERPADLPDFTRPPVTEVVLGVQFNRIERFLSPHLGLVWERFKPAFPHIEEHGSVPPVFETFGPNPQFPPTFELQVSTSPEMPRVLFINEDKTQLLQVQKDRFLHNWRKVGEGTDYPRFERMLETFERGFATFESVIRDENLGNVTPNQCEVSYINQIPVPEGGGLFEVTSSLFGQQDANLMLDDLGAPEDERVLLRYIIPDEQGNPAGRLIVSAEPARRVDGTMIIQLTLIARGKPGTPDLSGVVYFLDLGRLHMVRSFAKLTSPTMHTVWGRTR